MLKTFTLDNRVEKQSSKTQGTIDFHITDELNSSRVITGISFLNQAKVAQGISSENIRELPLLEGLFRLKVGSSIEIEFDFYNANFDRDSNKTVNQIAYDTIQEMEKEKKQGVLYRIGKKLKGKKRPEAELDNS